MNGFFEVLQDWNPLFQFLTLVLLAIYVWKTWTMAKATRQAAEASELSLKEMKAAREQQIQPYVICYFAKNKMPKFYDLVISNIGATMAFDVMIIFDPPLEHFDESLKRYDLTQKCFASLAPRQEWRTLWGSFIEEAKRQYPDPMSASITFRWGPSRRIENYEVSMDVSSLPDTIYIGEASIEASLEKIQESLGTISQRGRP